MPVPVFSKHSDTLTTFSPPACVAVRPDTFDPRVAWPSSFFRWPMGLSAPDLPFDHASVTTTLRQRAPFATALS